MISGENLGRKSELLGDGFSRNGCNWAHTSTHVIFKLHLLWGWQFVSDDCLCIAGQVKECSPTWSFPRRKGTRVDVGLGGRTLATLPLSGALPNCFNGGISSHTHLGSVFRSQALLSLCGRIISFVQCPGRIFSALLDKSMKIKQNINYFKLYWSTLKKWSHLILILISSFLVLMSWGLSFPLASLSGHSFTSPDLVIFLGVVQGWGDIVFRIKETSEKM